MVTGNYWCFVLLDGLNEVVDVFEILDLANTFLSNVIHWKRSLVQGENLALSLICLCLILIALE